MLTMSSFASTRTVMTEVGDPLSVAGAGMRGEGTRSSGPRVKLWGPLVKSWCLTMLLIGPCHTLRAGYPQSVLPLPIAAAAFRRPAGSHAVFPPQPLCSVPSALWALRL